MKLNKTNRALAIVLALGGGALVIDKFIIGYSDPSSAAAAPQTPALSIDQPAARPTPAPVRETSQPRVQPAKFTSLTERLSGLPELETAAPDTLNPFSPPESWSPKSAAPAEVASSAAPTEPRVPTPDHLHLSMTMLPRAKSGELPVAVINGEAFRQGEQIDGYRIESVATDQVSLRKGDRSFTLTIPRPTSERKRS